MLSIQSKKNAAARAQALTAANAVQGPPPTPTGAYQRLNHMTMCDYFLYAYNIVNSQLMYKCHLCV